MGVEGFSGELVAVALEAVRSEAEKGFAVWLLEFHCLFEM